MEQSTSGTDGNHPSALHQALVDQLIRDGFVRTPQVEAAFRAVPHHLFVPGVPLHQVYQNQVIPTLQRDGLAT